MWNNTHLKPIGEATLTVKNVRTGEHHSADFIIVPNDLKCLLGCKTLTDMCLITVNSARFISHVESEHEKLGNPGEAHLQVNPDMKPRVLPSRNVSITLKDEVKTEINHLVDLGGLVPVTQPTEWVSQMAVTKKSNGISVSALIHNHGMKL